MKLLYRLLPLLMCCASIEPAMAAKVTWSGFAFASSTPELEFNVVVDSKALITGALVAVDVGKVAPPGYVVSTAQVVSQQGKVLSFKFAKPDSGWPPGTYSIEIRDNETLIHSANFSVFAAKNP